LGGRRRCRTVKKPTRREKKIATGEDSLKSRGHQRATGVSTKKEGIIKSGRGREQAKNAGPANKGAHEENDWVRTTRTIDLGGGMEKKMGQYLG